MRYSALFALPVLALAASFCNGSEPSGGGHDPGYAYVDDFAAMLCNLNEQCCVPQGYTVPSDCLAQAKLQLHRSFDEDITAKGLKFDPVAAEQCLDAYRALAPSCPSTFSVPDRALAPSCPSTFSFPVCKRVFTDGTSGGSGCDAACVASDAGRPICGSSSSIAADGAVTETTYCQIEITVGPGEACDSLGRAPIVHHCDLTKNSNCIQGICSTPKPVGSACTSPDTNECAPEAICSANVCVARTPIGGACSAFECVPGAYCEAGKCRPMSKWKKSCSGDYD